MRFLHLELTKFTTKENSTSNPINCYHTYWNSLSPNYFDSDSFLESCSPNDNISKVKKIAVSN